MNERPLILITNDDGVNAKGIKELIECLRDLGELIVMAPDGPRSGMSSAITAENPLRYSLVKKEKGLTVYKCTGTPVDCVKLAINEVLDRKPDLLVRVSTTAGIWRSASFIQGRWEQRPKVACSVSLPWASLCSTIMRMPTLRNVAGWDVW